MSTSIGSVSSPSPMSSGRMPLSLLVDEASEARRRQADALQDSLSELDALREEQVAGPDVRPPVATELSPFHNLL